MKKIFIFLFLIVFLFLGGCSMQETKTKHNKTNLNNVVIKLTNNDNVDKNYIDKINDFSSRLTSEYIVNKDDNVAISPLSIYLAIVMTYDVIDEDLKLDLLNSLNINETDIKNTKSLINFLSRELKDENGKLITKLSITNSIWFDTDNGLNYNEAILEKLADDFYCYANQAPFQKNNSKANKIVRDFVKKQTNGLIDNDFKLDESVVALIMNTIYLKDIWDMDNPLETKQDKFNGNTQEFLIGKYYSGIVNNYDKYQSFYTLTDNGYKISFILPNEGVDIQDVFNSETINKLAKEEYVYKDEELKKAYYTRVIFPSFTAESDDDFKQILIDKFNMGKLFESFTSPLTDSSVYFSGVNHKAILKVDKRGIEGAAVTTIPMCGSAYEAYQRVYYDFLVNRSFGYIVSSNNGVILFSGIVNK